jgi:hypothetical protein
MSNENTQKNKRFLESHGLTTINFNLPIETKRAYKSKISLEGKYKDMTEHLLSFIYKYVSKN